MQQTCTDKDNVFSSYLDDFVDGVELVAHGLLVHQRHHTLLHLLNWIG